MLWRMSRRLPIVALLLSSSAAAAAQVEAPVETVLITARVPPPVGADVFSGALLDEEELRAAPQLDAALGQVPGLSLFRRNSSLSANPTTQGVSLRSIAPSGAGRALVIGRAQHPHLVGRSARPLDPQLHEGDRHQGQHHALLAE